MGSPASRIRATSTISSPHARERRLSTVSYKKLLKSLDSLRCELCSAKQEVLNVRVSLSRAKSHSGRAATSRTREAFSASEVSGAAARKGSVRVGRQAEAHLLSNRLDYLAAVR